MNANSHNQTINEDPKPWSKRLTAQEYDLKLLSAPEFRKKYKVSERERKELLAKLER